MNARASTARGQYVPVGGVDYYVERHGRGRPLLLLHGGFGSITMFGPVLEMLARQHQVIAVELYGHAHTALTDRPMDRAAFGDDMAALIDALGLEQVDVVGFSYGAFIAFQLAIRHPACVRRLVLVSMPMANDGFYPEILAQQQHVRGENAAMMMRMPFYTDYAAAAPRPGDFPRLVELMGNAIREPFDWSADVAKLTMPVLLVFGDADMIRPEHMVAFYQRLGGGLRDAGWNRETMASNRLAILPGVTHYDMATSPALAETANAFLG